MNAITEGAATFVAQAIKGSEPEPWGDPDMSVIQSRRLPPALPIELFGPQWAKWIEQAAEASAAPIDYVALPLLASVSALIGNARWAQATPGWSEPPHLWCGVVGDSGSSKSPGADCLLREVLPEIERRMVGDWPERSDIWHAAAEAFKAREEQWKIDVRTAQKNGNPPPAFPSDPPPLEPQMPRLRQNDVTIEKVASLLAAAAPKGLLLVRDELAGWFTGMTTYNDAGRSFWLEAYGGRPYRVERQKHPEPIEVRRLAVAVMGGTQPERLSEMFQDADDGLMARLIWAWPDARPFRLSRTAPAVQFAIDALDRLRLLELTLESPECPASPVMMPLQESGLPMLEAFAQDMQKQQETAAGLLRSAYGKARGLAVRLALNLEMLRWTETPNLAPPPRCISEASLSAACDLVHDYFMPMAERVYGDAAISATERNAATLARWIVRQKPAEVHVRQMQREVRLPGLSTAEAIKAAAGALVEADWLRNPPAQQGKRPKVFYPVNPALRGIHQ